MGTIVRGDAFVDATAARPEKMNDELDTIFNVINGNIDWDNLEATLVNAADGILKLDASGGVPLAQIPDTLTGKDADTVDGEHYSDITTKITDDIATHAAISAAHHARYTDAEAVAAVSVVGARRHLSSDKTISTASDTKVELDSEDWDIGGDFSNYKFTAPYRGYYQVNASICYLATGDKNYVTRVKLNGTTVLESIVLPSISTFVTVNVSDIIYMTVGQYLELYAYQAAGINVTVAGRLRSTFMSVQLLRLI